MTTLILLPLLGVLILYLGLFKANKMLLSATSVGLVFALLTTLAEWNSTPSILFSGMLLFDRYAMVFSSLFIITTLLLVLLSRDYFEKISTHVAEYYALMLFALSGMVMMVASHNLVMLFIGVETMSVCLYILAGIRKKDTKSNEAALKYFLMGAFATGILLMGITLIYGATASFDIDLIATYVQSLRGGVSPILYVGIVFLMIAFCFKIGAAPFHFWVPDVYEGAPTLITAFMATAVKIAGFAAFLRVFSTSFIGLSSFWIPLIFAIILLTLFIGNITALYQQTLKRMLAYSSISHAGYMLLAILVLGVHSNNAVLLYGVGYSFASIIAFAALVIVKQQIGNDSFDSFKGLAKKNPFLSFALTLSMLSFAGIPLTAGFVGKFLMFNAAIEQYQIWVVVLAIINAIISIYYYFRVIIAMYFQSAIVEQELILSPNYRVVIAFAVLVVLFFGICPSALMGLL